MATKDMPNPSRTTTVTVSVNNKPQRKCMHTPCGQSTDLMIGIHLKTELPPQGYCVDHWGQIRSLFLRRSYKIQYEKGAPQIIIERLTRIS